MNKKIYLNENFIWIGEPPVQPTENQVIIDVEKSSPEELNNYLKNFIQQSVKSNLILLSKDVNSTFEFLKIHFLIIEAAGGLIQNEDKYLFIFRLKKWDLPKGKMDPGETISQTAIRECEEECAIKELKIISELGSTYHIYPYKGSFALKISHWFLMESHYNGVLVPQLEENIEQVEWFTKEQVKNLVLPNTYPAISDVVNKNLF